MVDQIVHRSESQQALLGRLAKVAKSDVEVLITGPSGVGKELYAAFTHDQSRRAKGPLITVNCSNLPASMLENELFGHARGAYTGAHAAMGGIAEAAEGGSLFLDEVDSLPLMSQAKILRFIQNRDYRRLGDTAVRKADVRVIAASNADLEQLVRAGQFRQDLYFRLRVVPVHVPALAERREDIEPLLDHFGRRYASEYDLPEVRYSDSARTCLQRYFWPGNVRELENCVRYLTCLDLGRAVERDDLALLAWEAVEEAAERHDIAHASSSPPAIPLPANGSETSLIDLSLQDAKAELVKTFERHYVDQALATAGGNITKAARLSGKHRRAFFELLRKYGMDAEDYRRQLPPN